MNTETSKPDIEKDSPLGRKARYLNKLFRYMSSAKDKTKKFKIEDEELYFSDIEGTRTQFTKRQLAFIQAKYDIPLSINISKAIIEQVISFLTGGKPKVNFMAQEELVRPWVMSMKRLIDGLWYENYVDEELKLAIKDQTITGSGFLRVRKNNYYQESTYGVVVEYIPWDRVYIDPTSTKPDFSDADYICIARSMPKKKAEQEYDIKITDSDRVTDIDTGWADSYDDLPDYGAEMYDGPTGEGYSHKWVWIKEFMQLKNMKTYITPEGFSSFEEPTPTKIPNPDKMALAQQIQQMMMAIEQSQQQAQPQMNSDGSMPQAGEEQQYQQSQVDDQTAQMQSEVDNLGAQMEQMPNLVDAYILTTESGQQYPVMEYSVIKTKRVETTIMVGDKIKTEEVEPCDIYPLIHLPLNYYKNPYKTYGIIHDTKDLNFGINKLLGLTIYDMQQRVGMRMLYANQSIQDPEAAERKWAIPGAWIGYDADSELPDGGRPTPQDMSSVNQNIIQLLQMLQQFAEYITGIFGVVQGDPNSAPSTMGGTQSLQAFGTQRIKSSSRTIEIALSQLGYVMARYIQRYCPRDKFVQIMGEEADPSILDLHQDTRFKVRVEMSQSLPTSRQMAAAALSTLAGQTQSAGVQELLMQYMLKFMDIQEADEIAKAMDVISKYEQQLQQQGQQLAEMESQMKAAQNNIMQKDLALQREKGMADIKVEKERAIMDAKNAPMETEKANLLNSNPNVEL